MNQTQDFFEPLYIVPAYGRKYATVEQALQDWHCGKDFKIDCGGPYCSIRDIESMRKQFKEIRLAYRFDYPSIEV
jgi:hypothetical protein